MRRLRLVLPIVLVLAAIAVAASGGGAQAATSCPATFTVLHNDAVGRVKIPAGVYVIHTTRLSCSNASSLLDRFLDDFDGILPGGWVTARTGRGFVNGSTGSSFTLSSTGPGPTPGGGGRCPGTFTVLHNDRIGALAMRAGRYVINVRRMSCAMASKQLAFFLFHDFAGRLPAGWSLNVGAQRFSRGSSSFTVRFASSHGRSGGGGVHPNLAITCPGTVRLAKGTSIGALVLPAGRYYVNVFSNLSCPTAKRSFARFAAAGRLPAQWTLQVDTATFLRGREGFQVEPVN